MCIRDSDSPAMDYIVQGVLNDYLPIYERSPLTDETRAKIVEKWEEILKEKDLDQSEIIYLSLIHIYKAEVADALNPLSYKKQIKEAYTQLIEEVIEPLRVGR